MAQDLDLYRPNVGVVLFNRDGLVWYGHRNGALPPHDWQFPQGGVDTGEDLETAARRELQEETGVSAVSLLACTPDWFAYDFPPHVRKGGRWHGQKQVWYAFRLIGDETQIRLDQHHQIEFDGWRWGDLAQAPDLIVPFKQEAYRRVVEAFKPFAGLRA